VLRLTIKNLLDKKIRFALTTLAVVVGVAMVVGVFAMTDSLRSSFSQLAEDIAEATPLTVRTSQEVGREIDRDPVPASVDDLVRSVDGVDDTLPGVAAFNVVITDGSGEAILPTGPPTLGFSWTPLQFFITDGTVPAEPGQFAADSSTAGDNNLEIGSTYTISGPIEQAEFELVGIFNFGAPDRHTTLGQTMAAFELSVAQEFFGLEDRYSSIGVLPDPGTDTVEVQDRIQEAIGRDYEVVTDEVIEEEKHRPARLRLHHRVRQRVHHQQHLPDRRCSADP